MKTLTKTDKIIYWATTGLIALFLIPGIFFLNSEMALEGTKAMGMPMWFHWELGIAKVIGGIILIVPMFPARIKEWAYVGLGIDFISAAIGIAAMKPEGASIFMPIVMFAILVVSYVYFRKMFFDTKPGTAA